MTKPDKKEEGKPLSENKDEANKVYQKKKRTSQQKKRLLKIN